MNSRLNIIKVFFIFFVVTNTLFSTKKANSLQETQTNPPKKNFLSFKRPGQQFFLGYGAAIGTLLICFVGKKLFSHNNSQPVKEEQILQQSRLEQQLKNALNDDNIHPGSFFDILIKNDLVTTNYIHEKELINTCSRILCYAHKSSSYKKIIIDSINFSSNNKKPTMNNFEMTKNLKIKLIQLIIKDIDKNTSPKFLLFQQYFGDCGFIKDNDLTQKATAQMNSLNYWFQTNPQLLEQTANTSLLLLKEYLKETKNKLQQGN